MSRITLSKPALPDWRTENAPFKSSMRWCAPHESTNARGWPNIFLTQDAYRAINRHASSTLELEVGGMLIGDAYTTPDKQVVVCVEAQIEARHVEHSSAHLTFTSNTLAEVLDRLDTDFPGKRIVGWYHTHPALSIFLSSMDVWLHNNFFKEFWHVALVIDPYIHHGVFFCYAGVGAEYIHPKHYFGFHEVLGPDENSIVDWYNLTQTAEQGETISA